MTNQTPEYVGTPFRSVVVKRCSNRDHLTWEVIYPDGTSDRLHQGLWPTSLNPRRRQQLKHAAERFLLREQRIRPSENA
jgi:hypothetical protein